MWEGASVFFLNSADLPMQAALRLYTPHTPPAAGETRTAPRSGAPARGAPAWRAEPAAVPPQGRETDRPEERSGRGAPPGGTQAEQEGQE